MNILIVTQKVDRDDPILGFFHRWIEEYATRCERVTVICLYKGNYTLPSNVEVLSLGKELGLSRVAYIKNFYTYIWKYRARYDAVFVHMNHIYVLLGGLLWRMLKKRIVLWYVHRMVSWSLRIAERIVHVVCTSSSGAFRIASPKVRVVGHGIDTRTFVPAEAHGSARDTLRVVTVGRISPIKHLDSMIEAIGVLIQKGVSVHLDIIGGTIGHDDVVYGRALRALVAEHGLESHVTFVGSLSNYVLPERLVAYDIFLSMCETGSFDKAVLEAMSCGMLVMSPNEGFASALAPHGLVVRPQDAQDVARVLERVSTQRDQWSTIGADLRNFVIKEHSLDTLIDKLIKLLR